MIHVSGRAAIVHVSGHCVTVGIHPAARVVLVLVAWQVGFQRAGNLMLSIFRPSSWKVTCAPAAVSSSNIEQHVCKAPDGTFDAALGSPTVTPSPQSVQRLLVGTCGHCLSSVGLHRVFKYSVHRMPLDLTVDSWYTGRVQSTEHLRAQVGSPYGVLPTASRTDQTQ